MRYPAAETAEKHQKILAEASRLFKERGFDGVSVSEIMKATGLTHGPFYNHFDSKEALMAECITHSGDAALADLDAAGETPEGMRAYVRQYMSPDHRDGRADGCLVAAFAAHSGQPGSEQGVGAPLTAYLKSVIDRFARNFPWRSRKNAKGDAIRMLASMYGGVVLARAVDDEALSEEILREVLAGLQSAPKA
ncbi:TetR/AcrR family transcriptional regulator [Variovorax sp. 770b2]|uniref:TetR/AcrR family transcriptional regulator n=1 Tax=Variovorax sp. 770b2 TaxID=1566271 RepID=UPI0008EBF56E|nr:TetR/AcrR family transcriptional regulator [Variovorax sp. 770b2]SFQ12116.1 transcriptional regulator, TetR family [Variovorax sp. 770b2]